jgi:hypothetical protein
MTPLKSVERVEFAALLGGAMPRIDACCAASAAEPAYVDLTMRALHCESADITRGNAPRVFASPCTKP